MIENLEFKILHLKADGRPKDPASRVYDPSTSEHSNPKKIARRIPRICDRSQPRFQKTENGTSTDLNRNLNLIQAELKAAYSQKQGKSRNLGGVLLTCDGRPHSPWIKFLSRKTVVGSALLVRYAAHIAELIKNTSSIQTNYKNPCSQCFECVIGLYGLFVAFLVSSFEKILASGKMTFAGDIRRQS